MATPPDNSQLLPPFYKDLIPLSKQAHANYRMLTQDRSSLLVGQHAIPLTSDEIISASRHYPIIFSVGDNPVPLALMGLNEGINIFIDEGGQLTDQVYVPAYVRRYPFILAKATAESENLSLCFDPSSEFVGPGKKGDALFEKDGEPSEITNAMIRFCEQFEQASARTNLFIEELRKSELLMDGEITITPQNSDKPYVYRGFQMVNEEKLRDMRGDELRKMTQNGMLPLIFAHLFSLQMMRDVFAKQIASGKMDLITEAPAT